MKKKYDWHNKTICSYYCEKPTGKIVAQYSRVNFSDEVFHAQINGDSYGQYISEKCVRAAIEKKIAEMDDEEEKWKNHPLLKGVNNVENI